MSWFSGAKHHDDDTGTARDRLRREVAVVRAVMARTPDHRPPVFGAPGRCPGCGQWGMITDVDAERATSECLGCHETWTITRRALDEVRRTKAPAAASVAAASGAAASGAPRARVAAAGPVVSVAPVASGMSGMSGTSGTSSTSSTRGTSETTVVPSAASVSATPSAPTVSAGMATLISMGRLRAMRTGHPSVGTISRATA